MGLPSVLDVAIGLIFIFLILSLLASELQELFTTLLQWRAKHLRDSIEVLLAGGVGTQQEEAVRNLVHQLYDDPLIRNINQEAKGLAGKMRSITRQLNQKGTFGTNQATGPSYISPETFATSLLEQIGLVSLSRKLVEVRLEKFVTRIIGIYDDGQRLHRPVRIPPDQDERLVKQLWSKGRIRLIAEKVGLRDAAGNIQDLSQAANFQILVEEFDDILYDFETQECSLTTSVERMGESLSNYINSYSTTQADETEAVRLAKAAFVKRLETFKRGVFGEKNERAIASGGLRPSLLEIAELLDQTSQTYKEVNDSYQMLLTEGETLDRDMVPLLATKLLERHVPIVEKQVIQQYPQQVEEEFKRLYPEVFARFKQPLRKVRQKIASFDLTHRSNSMGHTDRPHLSKLLRSPARKQPQLLTRVWNRMIDRWQKMRSATPDELKRRQQKIMSDMFAWVTIEESRNLLRTILSRQASFLETIAPYSATIDVMTLEDIADNQPTSELCGLVNEALERLSREDRSLLIDGALSDLSQHKGWNELDEKKQRSLYTNYQTYRTIKQVLGRLPISVKESFTILARRAQMRLNKTENDVNRFREEVAVWFDRSMERATGVYKRNAKGVILLIGFCLAVLLNVDTGFIADRLSNDDSLRQAVIERAASIAPPQVPPENPPANGAGTDGAAASNLSKADLEAIRNDTKDALEELALPIGLNPANFSQQLDCPLPKNQSLPTDWEMFYQQCLPSQQATTGATKVPTGQPEPQPEPAGFAAIGQFFGRLFGLVIHYPDRLLRILLGWLLSGFAISMGAPFWFDLLSKIVNVRNTGNKPSSVEEQPSGQSASSVRGSR